MKFVPYLNFDGQCAEAFAFYAETLGAEVAALYRFGDESPGESGMPPLSDEDRQKVMHAELKLGDQVLYGSDSLPDFCDGEPCLPSAGMWVTLTVKDYAEGERVFAALAEGGAVAAPYGKTFFAEGFGQVRDRFGTPWMVCVAW